MLNKIAGPAAWLACAMALAARPDIVGWDGSTSYASFAGGMHFDRTPGNLEVTDFGFHLLLPDEIRLAENLTLQTAIDCRSTILRFNRVPTSFPINRNRLETFNVYPNVIETGALLVSEREDSPWMFGAWGRVGLATDSRDVGSDDITFDFTTGAAYRFHDSLTIGLAAAVTRLSGKVELYPGLGLDWQANEQFRIGLCGPHFIATYVPDPDWQFSVRADSTGEIWNISDGEGESRDIDFTSYRLGIQVSRKLAGDLYLVAGAGITFANEIGLNRSNGDVLLRQRLDSGLFSEIGLILPCW